MAKREVVMLLLAVTDIQFTNNQQGSQLASVVSDVQFASSKNIPLSPDLLFVLRL